MITYTRLYLPPSSLPVWSSSKKLLSKLHLDSEGKIEDADGFLQADFANSYIGGGVLRSGCLQEEIRFSTCHWALKRYLAPKMLHFRAGERFVKFCSNISSVERIILLKIVENKHNLFTATSLNL